MPISESDIWLVSITVIATLFMASLIGWRFWKILTGKSGCETPSDDKSPDGKPAGKLE